MNDKNDKMKIDINGSVKDSAHEVVSSMGGMFLIAITLGCLIAPIFASAIEDEMLCPNGKHYPPDYNYTNLIAKINTVKIGLWIIAFLAWCFVIAAYIYQ